MSSITVILILQKSNCSCKKSQDIQSLYIIFRQTNYNVARRLFSCSFIETRTTENEQTHRWTSYFDNLLTKPSSKEALSPKHLSIEFWQETGSDSGYLLMPNAPKWSNGRIFHKWLLLSTSGGLVNSPWQFRTLIRHLSNFCRLFYYCYLTVRTIFIWTSFKQLVCIL